MQRFTPRIRIRGLRLFVLALLVLALSAGCGSDGGATTKPESIGAGLTAPSGTSAAKISSGAANISALAEDSDGAIWFATAAYIDSGDDAMYRVADDGSATRVATGLHTPMGLLWLDDALYVSSADGITVFSGFDGTSFANQANLVKFPGSGVLGALVQGPDGRLRVGISASCDHCDPDSEWAAAVVSFLPDGSDVRVEASGIRAPVGLAYVPGTSDLLASMNQRDDLGDATPGDWLAVIYDGDDWGFPDCYGQGGAQCDGVPEPVAELDDHAAVSDLAVLRDSSNEAWAYVAEWSTGKILRIHLHPDGKGGYTGSPEDFVRGIQAPVAVLASSDGTLLIGDWNTGAIYRVTPPAA
ncbi:MAG: sorbosone dehydrogenase family protein [Dehalococcoidia bacterium]